MLSQTEIDPTLRERIDSERRYHEEHYRNAALPLELSFDLATHVQRRPHNLSWAHYDAVLGHFGGNLVGKRILEIGCGAGDVALNLAKQGALVDAFDLSEEAIAICNRRAQHNGLENVNFFTASSEDLELRENFFDAVVGTMILHHIDIPAATQNVFRLLKAGGLGAFAEWKEYPIVDHIRRAAPLRAIFPPGGVDGYATEHERKLSPSDFQTIRDRFPDMTLDYRYCLCGKVQYFSPKWAAKLERFDYWLLKMLPLLRWFTDGVVIKFTKPPPTSRIATSAPRLTAGPVAARNGQSLSEHRPKRRFVLLVGTARSGTTWLGNIFNSSPRSVYSHEPLLRYADDELRPLLGRIKKGDILTPDERDVVLEHWSRAYFAVRRPPFFAKDYSAWPAKAAWSAWLAVSAAGRGYRLFQHLFSPPQGANYDLVAKQGGLAFHGRHFVRALAPEALVVIMRHPCAVVASVRRGQKLGLMGPSHRARWFDDHLALAEEFGYGRREVDAMTDAEFESLNWLIENAAYEKVIEEHPNGHLVAYHDLCRDPLAVTETLFDALSWRVTDQTRRFLHDTSTRRTTRFTSLLTASHSYFSVYRPAKDSIDSWKRELTKREQDEIMAVARPLLERHWPAEERVGSG